MSYAGRRAGMHEGTRSGLWSEQCDAINAVRPRLAVWENVQAATSASASSRSDIVRHERRVAALRAAGLCACDNPDLDYPAGFRPPTGEGAVRADKALLDWARPRGLDVSGLECRRCGLLVYGPGPVAWTDRLGGRDTGPVIRALGRVLADLSLIGYDAVWRGIEAADVGAPHHRFRLFVVAWPQTPPDRPAETDLFRELDALPAPRPAGSPWAVFDRERDVWRSSETRLDGTADVFDGVWPTDGVMVSGRVWTAPAWPAALPRLSGAPARHGDADPRHRVSGSPLIPTPAARDAKGLNQRRNQENLPGAMELGTRLRSAPATVFMPTPRASDGAKGPSYNGHRVNLSGAILGQAGLLPTPTASDGMAERMRTGMWHAGSRGAMNLGIAGRIVTAGEGKARDPESYGFRVDWGRFAPAVRRWETILGRPAPDPTQATRRLRVLAGRLPACLRDGAWCARRIAATLPHGVDWSCRRRVIDRWAAVGAPGLIDPVWRSIASRDPDDPVGCTRLPARSVLDLWFRAAHTRVTVANLSPRLAEWMMGLPAGWVTDPAIWRNVPGNHRMLQLRALGNGVCPPQAERAVRDALDLRRKLSR